MPSKNNHESETMELACESDQTRDWRSAKIEKPAEMGAGRGGAGGARGWGRPLNRKIIVIGLLSFLSFQWAQGFFLFILT